MRSIFQKWPVLSISAAYFPAISRNDPAVLLILTAYCRVFSRSDPSDRFAQPTAFSWNDPFYLYLLPILPCIFPETTCPVDWNGLSYWLRPSLKWPTLLTRTEFEMFHIIDSNADCVFQGMIAYWLFFPGNVPPYWLSIFQETSHLIDWAFSKKWPTLLTQYLFFAEIIHFIDRLQFCFCFSGNVPPYCLFSKKPPTL